MIDRFEAVLIPELVADSQLLGGKYTEVSMEIRVRFIVSLAHSWRSLGAKRSLFFLAPMDKFLSIDHSGLQPLRI
jgi:hypothetical protein